MERLKKRPDFLKAAKGRRWAMPGLVLQARRRDENGGSARVGFTATRKVGGAVERNRVKRRLRAAVKAVAEQRSRDGFDYVLIGRRDTLTRSFDKIIKDLETALDKVHAHSAKAARHGNSVR